MLESNLLVTILGREHQGGVAAAHGRLDVSPRLEQCTTFPESLRTETETINMTSVYFYIYLDDHGQEKRGERCGRYIVRPRETINMKVKIF